MFGELMNDPNERMKMKDAISTAFDKPEFKNKEFIIEMGKNFRSACQKIGVKPNIKIKGAKTGVGGILGMLLQIPGILDAQKRADELGVDIWTIMLMDYGFFDVPGPT